jgi:hypothetical protein
MRIFTCLFTVHSKTQFPAYPRVRTIATDHILCMNDRLLAVMTISIRCSRACHAALQLRFVRVDGIHEVAKGDLDPVAILGLFNRYNLPVVYRSWAINNQSTRRHGIEKDIFNCALMKCHFKRITNIWSSHIRRTVSTFNDSIWALIPKRVFPIQ